MNNDRPGHAAVAVEVKVEAGMAGIAYGECVHGICEAAMEPTG